MSNIYETIKMEFGKKNISCVIPVTDNMIVQKNGERC